MFLRSLHLFQLNPILGPIATWMTSVVKDVFVIFRAWFVFYFSFVFGIHLVLNNVGDEPNCEVRMEKMMLSSSGPGLRSISNL